MPEVGPDTGPDTGPDIGSDTGPVTGSEAETTHSDGLNYGVLGDSLGFLLRLGQLRSFAQFYKDMGALDIRPGEMTILFVLGDNPGVRQGVLARALRIKRAHMTKMVHGLEAGGLIRRTVPEDDKRSIELWLTEAGQARINAVLPLFRKHDDAPLDGLSAAETAQLKRLLRQFVGLKPR